MSIRELVFIILMGAIACAALWLIMPVRRERNEKLAQLEELQRERDALVEEIDELKKENSRLEQEEPYSLQRAARETYDLCYPGERIYQFPKRGKYEMAIESSAVQNAGDSM